MNKNIALEALLDNLSKAMSNKSWQSFKSSEFNKLNPMVDKIIATINQGDITKPNSEKTINSLFNYINKDKKDEEKEKTYQQSDVKRFNELIEELLENNQCISNKTNLILAIAQTNLKHFPNDFKSSYNDISLVENAVLKANIMTCLYNYASENDIALEDEEKLLKANSFLLMSFDFSGIQNFVFDVPMEGALRNLRSRSFYLEMASEVLVDQILNELNLTRVHVIYVGGGHGYLLLPNTNKAKEVIKDKIDIFNSFFLNEFDYKIYISHSFVEANSYELMSVDEKMNTNERFNELMSKLLLQISKNKREKYNINILDKLNDNKAKENQRECSSCGKTANLIKSKDKFICSSCNQFQQFSRDFVDEKKKVYLLYKKQLKEFNELIMPYQLEDNAYLYALSIGEYEKIVKEDKNAIIVAYIKNSPDYIKNNIIHLSFVDDVLKDRNGQLSIDEIADLDEGIKRIAVLKLDVDSLGLVFKEGFPKDMYNIARMASLSDKLTYYFKEEIKSLTKDLKLSFVFSGGDDVFLFGTLSDVLLFSKNNYYKFNKYTQGKLHFSAGIGIFPPKYPIYKISDYVDDLILAAKSVEGKNSVTIFDDLQTFKWEEFFQILDLNNKNSESNILQEAFNKKIISNTMLYNQIYKPMVNLEKAKEPEKVAYRLMYLLGRIKREKSISEEDPTFKQFSNLILNAANIKQNEFRKRLLLAIQIHLYKNRTKESSYE